VAHGHWKRGLPTRSLLVPSVDVKVRPAYGSGLDLDEDVCGPNLWFLNFLNNDPGFRLNLSNSFQPNSARFADPVYCNRSLAKKALTIPAGQLSARKRVVKQRETRETIAVLVKAKLRPTRWRDLTCRSSRMWQSKPPGRLERY